MLNSSEADYLHLDVMDGVFVPNITFGFPVIKAINAVSTIPIDAHLMIVEPSKIHITTKRLRSRLHNSACRSVYSHLSCDTAYPSGRHEGRSGNKSRYPVTSLEDIITDIDMVLLMSVNPGFGGQSFIKNTLPKVARLKKMITESESHALISVDGGINAHTGALLAQYGIDMLVAGSYVFNAPDPHHAIRTLKAL